MTTSNNDIHDLAISHCPFCNLNVQSVIRRSPRRGPAIFYVICENCGAQGPECTDADQAILVWNRRATTAPKHRPSEVLTAKDSRDLGDVLFQNDIYIEHVLPLHAAPATTHLEESWEALGDRLEDMDEEELGKIFGPNIGGFIADVLDENEAEALLMALRRIGGWVILGTYPTVDNIKLNESGHFASCSVICGIQRMFIVWGRTYKQAVARAVRQRRRYFRSEVEKAREAAGYGRA